MVLDGKRAVKLAAEVCELSEWKDTNVLDVLTAPCTEIGDFDAAVKWERKVIEQRDESLKEPLEKRLKLYEVGEPYRPEIGAADGAG